MSNSYFQFKQFRIEQGKTAMKVCTDACIFGAWVVQQNINLTHVLDIGAGTGLLMHIIAQAGASNITGIEIEEGAFVQCSENIAYNHWAGKMTLVHSDIKNFKPAVKYDFVITNPPFYENDLISETATTAIARHSTKLNLSELIQLIPDLLTDEGKFAILLPWHRKANLLNLAEKHGLYPLNLLTLKHSPKHSPFRIIGIFSTRNNKPPAEEVLIIREEDSYTKEFISLLQPYYLYL